jgi:hypothetical protein
VQGSGRDWKEVGYEQGKGQRIAGDDKGLLLVGYGIGRVYYGIRRG